MPGSTRTPSTSGHCKVEFELTGMLFAAMESRYHTAGKRGRAAAGAEVGDAPALPNASSPDRVESPYV